MLETMIDERVCGGSTGAAITRSLRAGLTALLSVALCAPATSAQSRPGPRFSFDAFGAFGLVHSSERLADFAEVSNRPRGPGFSNSVDANLDSRVAGQATVSFGSKLTGVLQVMVEQTLDGDYAPHAEWANVAWSFTPDLRIRGGRIVFPVFMVSDARKVSYAMPWIRPPVELYSMVPVYNLDGVDATYRTRIGEWTGTVNALFGRTETEYTDGVVEATHAWNVNTTLVRGGFAARVAASGTRIRTDLAAQLFDGFRAFGPEGEAIAARSDLDGKVLRAATAGFEFDPGTWFTMAEFGWFDTNSAIGERVGGHVTSGFRWRSFTPYATYSRTELLSETTAAGLTVIGLPPEYAQAAAGLNAGLDAMLNSPPMQQNVAIGGRWDFMPGVAVKVQLDFVDRLRTSGGTFMNEQPGFERGGSARLFSVATAFVF
jgi:hypothetical protein